jgi:tryptophan-rich sensory protein
MRNLPLASLDIILVLVTLVWALYAIYPFARWVTFVNAPYLLWVMFASVLQVSITWMNR